MSFWGEFFGWQDMRAHMILGNCDGQECRICDFHQPGRNKQEAYHGLIASILFYSNFIVFYIMLHYILLYSILFYSSLFLHNKYFAVSLSLSIYLCIMSCFFYRLLTLWYVSGLLLGSIYTRTQTTNKARFPRDVSSDLTLFKD